MSIFSFTRELTSDLFTLDECVELETNILYGKK